MRVSTSFMHRQGIRNIVEQQSRVIETQQQLATGKKNLNPSDNPGEASRVLDLSDALNKVEQFDRNIDFATQKLALEDSVLEGIENVLQRVRELSVQAGNTGILDEVAKESIAIEIDELNKQLFDLANTQESNGQYLFSGLQSDVTPISRSGANTYTYNGDQEELSIQIGHNRQIVTNDSGADIFQLIRTGNGKFATDSNNANTGSGVIKTGSVVDRAAFLNNDYTIRFTSATTYEIDNVTTGAANITGSQNFVEGASITFDGIDVSIEQTPATGDTFTVNTSRNQDMFTSIQNLVNAMRAPADTEAETSQYSQGVANAINNMDRSLENIINARVKVGTRLNTIESQKDSNSSRTLHITEIKSKIEDLDYAEAITSLTFQTTALQAAQQSFVKIQNLSLFNFI